MLISLTSCSELADEDLSSDQEQLRVVAQADQESIDEAPILIDYAPIPFERLIGTAELIVIGSVEEIGARNFEYHIEDFLLNRHKSSLIDVKQHIPSDIFASRLVPYKRGQRFALFLTKSASDGADQSWSILGSAGEGELPIDGEFVYFDTYDLEGLEFNPYEVHGVTKNSQRLDLSDFRDGVAGYRACFSWNLEEKIKNEKVRTRWVPSGVCDGEAVRNYRKKSWIHEYLTQRTLQQIPAGSD